MLLIGVRGKSHSDTVTRREEFSNVKVMRKHEEGKDVLNSRGACLAFPMPIIA